MLLKQSESIAGIIELNRVDGKGIPQSMRAYSTHFACLGINQRRQASSGSAVPDDLPCHVAIYLEDELNSVSAHRTTALDIVSEHRHCLSINWQSP